MRQQYYTVRLLTIFSVKIIGVLLLFHKNNARVKISVSGDKNSLSTTLGGEKKELTVNSVNHRVGEVYNRFYRRFYCDFFFLKIRSWSTDRGTR